MSDVRANLDKIYVPRVPDLAKLQAELIRSVNHSQHKTFLWERYVDEVDVVNTTTETTILTKDIPPNALGTTGSVRLRIIGDYLNNSGSADTFILRVKLGSTTLYQDTTASLTASASRRAAHFELLLGNITASSQVLGGVIWLSEAGGATTGLGGLNSNGALKAPIHGTASESTTVTKTLDITVQHTTANANISFRMKYATLELV